MKKIIKVTINKSIEYAFTNQITGKLELTAYIEEANKYNDNSDDLYNHIKIVKDATCIDKIEVIDK